MKIPDIKLPNIPLPKLDLNPAKLANLKLSPYQEKKCKEIIHGASVAAGGAGTGLAQIPLADNAVITPIQIGMIVMLGKVFDQTITDVAAQALLSSYAASIVGRGLSQVLLGWIPFVGNAVNTATAAGLTEAIGWMAAAHFLELENEEKNEAFKEAADKQAVIATEESAETDSQRKEVETLLLQARAFLSGEKSKDEAKEDLQRLLNDLSNAQLNDPDNKEIREIYQELLCM